MDSFEAIGHAQLLAAEGQRQVAFALVRALHGFVLRIARGLARHALPSDAML